jgi:hypothetical protein
MATRRVVRGSYEEPVSDQPVAAYTPPTNPSARRVTPTASPVSSLKYRNIRSRVLSSGRSPSLRA